MHVPSGTVGAASSLRCPAAAPPAPLGGQQQRVAARQEGLLRQAGAVEAGEGIGAGGVPYSVQNCSLEGGREGKAGRHCQQLTQISSPSAAGALQGGDPMRRQQQDRWAQSTHWECRGCKAGERDEARAAAAHLS